MKRTLLVLLAVAIAFGAVGCSEGVAEADTPVELSIEGSLEEIVEKIYLGVDHELPMTMTTVVDESNLAYFLGSEEVSFTEALASEPMMSSIAHSVVLLRAEEGADIEALMQNIKENADPRKWICVGVEEDQVIVDHVGDLVILIMDQEAEALHQSFLNLAE